MSDRLAADDGHVRHTGGGLRLVGLTVLAVGFLPMPSIAKQDPKPSQDPSAQVQLPPGQAKKQAAAQQPAPAPAPARQPAPAPAPAPAPTKHQAKHEESQISWRSPC